MLVDRNLDRSRSNTSPCPFKPHVMQNRFCLDVVGIIIRLLVLVTPHAVDFEAQDWCGNSGVTLYVV
ncbi:hypothetical protein TNCV_1771711 [Trichonephila clavipes]|nr:hypothetical protein TNCV_1771711 [Trichonephila clavipes]